MPPELALGHLAYGVLCLVSDPDLEERPLGLPTQTRRGPVHRNHQLVLPLLLLLGHECFKLRPFNGFNIQERRGQLL